MTGFGLCVCGVRVDVKGKKKAIDGFKEVVNEYACYATISHDHFFGSKKHATEAYATSGTSLGTCH